MRVDLADKARGIGNGGIGVVHQLARQIRLVDAIDRRVQILKMHRRSSSGDPSGQAKHHSFNLFHEENVRES